MLYVRTRSPPDWGHRRIPSVSLCIIAFSLPPQSLLHHTRPPSLFIKMSSCYCLLASKQTKLALGAEQVVTACICAKKTQQVSCNVMHLFPVWLHFPRECNRHEIVKWGVCDRASLRLVYSGGKSDFS